VQSRSEWGGNALNVLMSVMTWNCQVAGHELIIILIFSLQAKSSRNCGTSHQWASKDSVFLILIVLRPKGLSSEVTVSGCCSSSVDNLLN
jgi:hypothetical protein